MKDLIVVLVSVVLSLGLALVVIKPNVVTNVLGGASGPTYTEQQEFLGGVVMGGVHATTSQGNVTVTAGEFKSWLNSGLVSFSPGLLAGATITLPASSTIPNLVPKAGMSQRFCIQNATSTANIAITLAGGTGTKFLVASSSATALGSTKIFTGKVGCFTFIREVATSSASDIVGLFEAYQ